MRIQLLRHHGTVAVLSVLVALSGAACVQGDVRRAPRAPAAAAEAEVEAAFREAEAAGLVIRVTSRRDAG